MNILLLLHILMLSSYLGVKSTPTSTYYQGLYDECKALDEFRSRGCRGSVEWMEKNNFRESLDRTCPEGQKWNMNKTLGSKGWCEPAE